MPSYRTTDSLELKNHFRVTLLRYSTISYTHSLLCCACLRRPSTQQFNIFRFFILRQWNYSREHHVKCLDAYENLKCDKQSYQYDNVISQRIVTLCMVCVYSNVIVSVAYSSVMVSEQSSISNGNRSVNSCACPRCLQNFERLYSKKSLFEASGANFSQSFKVSALFRSNQHAALYKLQYQN